MIHIYGRVVCLNDCVREVCVEIRCSCMVKARTSASSCPPSGIRRATPSWCRSRIREKRWRRRRRCPVNFTRSKQYASLDCLAQAKQLLQNCCTPITQRQSSNSNTGLSCHSLRVPISPTLLLIFYCKVGAYNDDATPYCGTGTPHQQYLIDNISAYLIGKK